MTETYYDRLGVDPDASTAEVEQAYRDRLKETHPDVSDDEDASERTRALIEARDVLTDEDERARYDRLGHEQYVDGQTTPGPGPGPTAQSNTAAEKQSDSRAESDSREGNGDESPEWADWGADVDETENGGPARDGTGAETDPAGGNVGRTGGVTEDATWSETRRAGRASWNDGRRDAGTQTGTSEGKSWRAWDTDASYSLREGGLDNSRLVPSAQSVVLLASTFLLYPFLLWATLSPSFPLVVNAAVGVCLLGVVTYLQTIPEVGIAVFGSWSVLLVGGLFAFGVELFSLLMLAVLVATVLPLGLSVLVRATIRT